MTLPDPALIRIDKARLHNARVRDGPRLGRVLDQLTPASIGIKPQSTLIVRHLALRTPLSRTGSADRFIAAVRDDLRARFVSAQRGRKDDHDFFFEDDVALETAIVAAWLAPNSGPSWVHAIGAATPLTRWRRTILPDHQLLPRILARLVEQGFAEQWLNQFDPAEIRAVTVRLLQIYGATIPAVPVATKTAVGTTRPDRGKEPTAATSLQEARSIIRPDLRILVGVALTIVRRPTTVAIQAFAEALVALVSAPGLTIVAPLQPSPLSTSPRRSLPISSSKTSRKRLYHRTRTEIATPADNARSRFVTHSVTEAPPPNAADCPAIATGYGGLFFLFNAFLALGLYGDFTRSGGGLKGLSPFELMHLLGTRWFGARFTADPIAPLLLTLAGLQPREKPGRSFEPPLWSVPEDWLRPWPKAKPHRFPLVAHPDLPARRWISYLSRYLRARLQQSLDDHDAVAITCTQPGRITLDRDRITVHFPLADHPIALRFAGLDRDPGWVPAAAHFIEFKFA